MKKNIFISILILALVTLGYWSWQRARTPASKVPTESPAPAAENALWPADEVKKTEVQDNGDRYTIDAFYPETNSAAVTNYMKEFVTQQVSQFKDDTSWINDPSAPESSAEVSLSIDYTSEKSPTVETYIFTVSSDTGGAHGMTTTTTFSFLKSGELLTLQNLFTDKDKGLAKLSSYAIADLEKRTISDDKWINDGAGPTDDNYHSFSIEDGTVTVYFDPYQVAAYAAGPQKVVVPFSSLTPYLSSAVTGQ